MNRVGEVHVQKARGGVVEAVRLGKGCQRLDSGTDRYQLSGGEQTGVGDGLTCRGQLASLRGVEVGDEGAKIIALDFVHVVAGESAGGEIAYGTVAGYVGLED